MDQDARNETMRRPSGESRTACMLPRAALSGNPPTSPAVANCMMPPDAAQSIRMRVLQRRRRAGAATKNAATERKRPDCLSRSTAAESCRSGPAKDVGEDSVAGEESGWRGPLVDGHGESFPTVLQWKACSAPKHRGDARYGVYAVRRTVRRRRASERGKGGGIRCGGENRELCRHEGEHMLG